MTRAFDTPKSAKRPSGPRLLAQRNPPTASAMRARLRIAHVQATAEDIHAVEQVVDCPSCGQRIQVELEEGSSLIRRGEVPARSSEVERETAAVQRIGDGMISTVMREAPWVARSASVSALIDIFEATRAPSIVVVDAERRPLGVVTPVDLFAEIGSRGPTTLAGLALEDLATTPVLYLRADTRISSALRLFIEHKPECVVVLSDSGKLAGVVGSVELLRFLAG